MARILVAPDKFKGSLTAPEVADAVAAGLRSANPSAHVVCLPVADGGDGTVAAVVAAGWTPVTVHTTGPTGAAVTTTYARHGDTAVVELASAVGLERMPDGRRDALGAGTYGLGIVVVHALESGARKIVLGLGGSASTDGGAGMLQAMGVRVLDSGGNDVRRGGAALIDAVRLDSRGLHSAATEATFMVACDVDNPLLGPHGASAVYAPQKGAGRSDVVVLEDAMTHWETIVSAATGRDLAHVPGAGAAGGTAFGAMAVLGATVHPGIGTLLELIDFHTELAAADLVVTGEGSLDRQSLHGKAPIGVADAAHAAGIPVVTVSGRNTLSDSDLAEHGVVASYALSDLEPDVDASIRGAAELLRRVGDAIGTSTLASTLEGAS